MGKIQDVEHAEDQRITHGEEPVDAAYKKAVDQLLSQNIHLKRRSFYRLFAKHREFPAFHDLDDRRMLCVASGGKGEFSKYRVEIFNFAHGLSNGLVIRCRSCLPDGLISDIHTGIGLGCELIGRTLDSGR